MSDGVANSSTFESVFRTMNDTLAQNGQGVQTMNGWCDDLTGWGPTTSNGNALTMCFCSTVVELPTAFIFLVYAVPRLRRVLREPEVKPAPSWRFLVKLLLTVVALVCAIVLTIDDDPASPAVKTSMALTSLSWLVSMALLVLGYRRHLPSFTCLRLWWIVEFSISVVIFIMHAEVHQSRIAHIVRGCYAATCVLLGVASLRPRDQPDYQYIDLNSSALSRSFSESSDIESAESQGAAALSPSAASISDETPLLDSYSGYYDSSVATSSGTQDMRSDRTARDGLRAAEASQVIPPLDSDDPRQLERRLSSNLLMTGASSSRYQALFTAFNNALYGSGERNEHRKSPDLSHMRKVRR
eukprot:CAMPEP_0171497800 /NCGR_PEP_ID=MMETSP0958-20121227/7478_1 /TAXON_ID=87120 /ORGANISM="Aurantiochytrium limacinum, Strain ATCCMYA-1381" /LENGTH=355 /DNA_ID=CAMNT_0012032093 /DNA_START=113 /DNA_END=1180 /DNA_ORIENTATION=+